MRLEWLGLLVRVHVLAVGSCFIGFAGEATPVNDTKPKPIPDIGLAVLDSAETVSGFTPTAIKLPIKGRPKNERGKFNCVIIAKPEHGTLKIAVPMFDSISSGAMQASVTYTAEKGYVGKDAFTWKITEGEKETKASTCTLTVVESVPRPLSQMAFWVVENGVIDIPASYIGGAGYSTKIEFAKPAHGTVTLDGEVFRYKPDQGYVGPDSFTWHMTYSKDAKAPSGAKTNPCTYRVVSKKSNRSDWPQWRADEWRSGYTDMNLPQNPSLQWKRELPRATETSYPRADDCRPVQMGKTIFVPLYARDSIAAFSTDTGEARWRYYSSGAIRRPPVAMALEGGANQVVFGCDDGWVYALDAENGSVRWKFRAAPNNKKAMGFGRLSSVWPIWASPVASNGKIYVAAGYLGSFGIYAYCLDGSTGRVLWANDGRISDLYTSAFGPLAVSVDGTRILGSTNSCSTPWVADASTGEFLGHADAGFQYPGKGRKTSAGRGTGVVSWYVDGDGNYHMPEPLNITAGQQVITPGDAKNWGVQGTISSMLAGDGKLFVTTIEGSLYCFGGAPNKSTVHAITPVPLADIDDGWTTAAKTMLSREDLKSGLALVLGIKNGRLVEELAKRSALMVVAVDPDSVKLQTLMARMDAAGMAGARVSILEGKPAEFTFAPYQAAIITSEVEGAIDGKDLQSTIERLYSFARPFGGEVWLPTSDAQNQAFKAMAAGTSLPLADIAYHKALGGLGCGFTQIIRKGMPDDKLRLKPPFGIIAFGARGMDVFDWSPIAASEPRAIPQRTKSVGATFPGFPPGYAYPSSSSVSTPNSIFTSLVNPLYGLSEKFQGIPSSGAEKGCYQKQNQPPHRCGDFGVSQGKMPAFYDASSHYWGRFLMPEFGGCASSVWINRGVVGIRPSSFRRGGISANSAGEAYPTPFCGCLVDVTRTGIVLGPVNEEENWFLYQTQRTSRPVDDLPLRHFGINFGARGDRFVDEDAALWTHHPHAWNYGRVSYAPVAMLEAMPLVPVSYKGNAMSSYHHSAQMAPAGPRGRTWVSASYVKGMSEVEIPLFQPAVAVRTATEPKVDGDLGDPCWDGQRRLFFTINPAAIDPDRVLGPPLATNEGFALLRYDDVNLYVAVGVRAEFQKKGSTRSLPVTVALNNRDRLAADVVLTGKSDGRQSKGLAASDWSFTCKQFGSGSFHAEMSIPWNKLAAAGLWKEQLVLNVSTAGGSLAPQYTPLFLDAPRGVVTEPHPHTVRLFFAEMEDKSPGQRIFDVNLQGKTVLQKFDVVEEAGGSKREVMKEFRNVSVIDKLKIAFVAHEGEPVLSGVEVIGNYSTNDHSPNVPPCAKIAASVRSGAAPLEVNFSAMESQDPDGQIVQCVWETGDGRLGKGAQLRHIYAEPGTYKVTLLVRDSRGGISKAQTEIAVTPGVPAAFICAIRAKCGDYSNLSTWEAAVRSDLTSPASRLFNVRNRNSYATEDDGKRVTFAGGGTGTLRHVNGANIAYITDCAGAIQAGDVRCASGHTFETADDGHPICAIIAECYNDWPDGLEDRFAVPKGGTGWCVDPLRCVTIRPAVGQGHRGLLKDEKGGFAGFTLRDGLNALGMPYTRIHGIALESECVLAAGKGSSVNRVLAGEVSMAEDGMAANCVAMKFNACSISGQTNFHASYYFLDGPASNPAGDGKAVVRAPASRVGFYNCTGKTFDPGNQAGVEFINCLAAPGGEGFKDLRYADPGYANRCVSVDASSVRWDCGDGSEGNASNCSVQFVNAAKGDYRLAVSDKDAKGRGAPGLGADIAGNDRTNADMDVGAYNANKN